MYSYNPIPNVTGVYLLYVRSVVVSFRFHQAEVLDQMKVVIKDITAERKTHMIEGAKRINELKLTMDQLDKVGPLSFLTPHPFFLLPLSFFSSPILPLPPSLSYPLPSLFSSPFHIAPLFCSVKVQYKSIAICFNKI